MDVTVFGGVGEGGHGRGGIRPDLAQRAGGAVPDISVGVFEGGGEGWRGSPPDLA
jgi:hypothetical protein